VKRPRKYPEAELQKLIVRHIKLRGRPGLVYWHTPSGAHLGGKRNRKGQVIQRGILAGMGARAGVSDLVFLYRSLFFALEVKHTGTPTEEQYQFLADVEAAGGFSAWAVGLDRCLKVLEGWGLLKGVTA